MKHRAMLTMNLLFAGLISLAYGYSEASVPKRGLIGYWQGNGNADDSSKIGNNGSFSGSYVQGHRPRHEAFDLSTGAVSVPNVETYDLQQYKGWTVGFWFNTNGMVLGNNNGTFLGSDDGGGCNSKWFVDYGYSPDPSTTFVLHVNQPNCDDEKFLQSESVSIPSGWNQLTVVRETKKVAFYLNGRSVGLASYTGATPYPAAPLSFGALEACCNYYGWMDDVVLYDRPLSAQEVQELATP